jgi:hypothetical protein
VQQQPAAQSEKVVEMKLAFRNRQLSNRCRWAGLDVAHYRHLLRLTDKPPNAHNSSDDSNLVYLIKLDDVRRSDKQPTNPGAFPPQRT